MTKRGAPGALAWLVLVAAVAAASSSVILIKAGDMHPFPLSAIRLLGAAIFLSPLYFRETAIRRETGKEPRSHGAAIAAGLVPGAIIAFHMISWVVGARMTTAGNSTLIVNMNPVAMPFAAFALSGLKPTRRELAATAVALCGVLVMGMGDFNLSREYFVGDAVCFASMVSFAAYLAFSRKRCADGRLWTYVVPLYAVGGALCLAAAAATPGALAPPSAKDALLALGLIVGPTVVGHSALNWAMTVFRPQTVTIVNLFQFVFAVVLAWALFGEVPEPLFYPTTALILAGALLSIFGGLRSSSTPARSA